MIIILTSQRPLLQITRQIRNTIEWRNAEHVSGAGKHEVIVSATKGDT